jgi:hypothetical protein
MTKIAPQPQLAKKASALHVEALVDALQKRTSWKAMRETLKREQLPIGQGWKDLTTHAIGNSSEAGKLQKFIESYFADSILAGERYIQLYQLSKEEILQLLDESAVTSISDTDFSSTYPLPLDQKALAGASSEPKLCEVRTTEGGDVSFVFCSARYHDDRLSYDYKDLPQHVKDTYKQIDKLVTYQKIFYQAYDVVTIRKTLERIEVSIDQPSKSSNSSLETLPLAVLSTCALHVQSLTGIGARAPENLFSAIAGMYYQSKEGTVKALSFRTLTGSIKKERMTTSTDDLRDEKFHHAGMNAVGQKISPYELTLDLNFKSPEGHATLSLSALIRELSSATPTLHGCYVSSVKSLSQELTLNRLMTYVN